MRSHNVCAWLLWCVVTGGAAARAADFSGKWQIDFRTSSSTSAKPLCTLEQKGNRISGSCKGPHSEGPISGTVSGRAVEFTWKTGQSGEREPGDGQMHSGGGVWTFQGTLGDDNNISGAGTAPTEEKGQFTARRQ